MKKYSVTVNYNEKELCQQFENKSDAVEEAKHLLHVVGISLLPEEASLLSTAFRELFFEKSSNSVHVDISAGINLSDARVTFRKTANEQSSKDPSHPIVYLKHELIDLLQDTRYSIDEHLHDLTIRMQQPEGIISVEFNFTLGGYIWGISFPNGKSGCWRL